MNGLKNKSTTRSFPVRHFTEIKEKVLNWLARFNTFCFLDNHQYQLHPHSLECLAGAGVHRIIEQPAGHALAALDDFIADYPSWLFGHLGYELKNEIEKLHSAHPRSTGFADLCFFEPEFVVQLTATSVTITANDPLATWEEIVATQPTLPERRESPSIQARLSRDQYISIIEQLRQHILRGDCYEINFCQEFFAENVSIDPLTAYRALSSVSPNPFSALYRHQDQWLLCASPERFLQKSGNHILSQPIKGTARRIHGNHELDLEARDQLFNSAKDRSENVMVVDLVRNDLARICLEGTVQVEELYGVYSFPQVHQLISTISGELADGLSLSSILRATFPMGSMTGAPKKRVMELIEQYEQQQRGLFSGAVGYITPGGDFDFNVVIRSILYNATTNYLSLPAGSGITWYSNPAQEWEECLSKAEAMKKALSS